MRRRSSNLVSTIVTLVAFVALLAYAETAYYHRCEDLGGDWRWWRGCRVINKNGDVQWITRP